MSESDKIISVITCDVEGRIETFNDLGGYQNKKKN